MPKRGRPRSARAASVQIVRIKLRLYPGQDDDLIAFFAEVPRGLRALSVKTALRSGVQSAEGEANRPDDALLDSLEGFVF